MGAGRGVFRALNLRKGGPGEKENGKKHGESEGKHAEFQISSSP